MAIPEHRKNGLAFVAVVLLPIVGLSYWQSLRIDELESSLAKSQHAMKSISPESSKERKWCSDLEERIERVFAVPPQGEHRIVRLTSVTIQDAVSESPKRVEAPESPLPFETLTISPGSERSLIKPWVYYSGEPVTLKLKTIPLSEAIVAIALRGNLNIVVTSDVVGTASIDLKEVKWDKALHYLLFQHGLDQVTEGIIVRVSTEDRLKKERELLREMERANMKVRTN